ncbi:hypothetical protein [Histidinibacterium aquaticum]|uniref:Curlin n=1 Tax=Histidinibacterium aquaticum TaxID=2613962 RepID=A0A5J5GCB1_9RHOB|nr:hypothetical protein [Histidinibacterium aquaticum]KAA9005074.1 hypothetical protein F3S47_18775 [Histidinibacterium aquaticum]
MQYSKIAALVLAIALPSHAAADEAFISQISAGPVSVSLPAPVSAPVNVSAMLLEAPRPTISTASVNLDAYPLVAAPTNGAYADISTTGDHNSANIVQSGIHAASIRQSGNMNSALITQSNGAGNRASIYQASSNGSAMISQSGSNNRALIVQN